MNTENPGVRFIIGISIIAVSIYAFYISITLRNSPELFIVPTPVTVRNYPCAPVRQLQLSLCIPLTIDYSPGPESLEFFSTEDKIRGSIRVMDSLPEEAAWRNSLHNPFINGFIGKIDTIDTYHLMRLILEHKYNPLLMGAKASLIPAWMKSKSDAQILLPVGNRSILFYTPEQSLGLIFIEDKVVSVTCTGYIDKDLVAGIMRSITFI